MADPRNPCTLTGKRNDVSQWEFVGAVPEHVTTSAGGGAGVGISQSVTCLWKRTFSLEYSCSCNGKTADNVSVPGNLEYYKITIPESYPTISLSLGLPLPEALGAIADALGAGINIADFWAPNVEAMVNKRAEQDAPTDSDGATPGTKSKIKPAPVAVCGRAIDFGGGNVAPWPSPGTPPLVPPDDRTQLVCSSATTFTKSSIGWGTGNDNADAKADAERHLKLVTPSDIQRFLDDYKCQAPCTMKLPPKILYTTMTFTPPENPSKKSPHEAYSCFASWDWTISLECLKG